MLVGIAQCCPVWIQDWVQHRSPALAAYAFAVMRDAGSLSGGGNAWPRAFQLKYHFNAAKTEKLAITALTTCGAINAGVFDPASAAVRRAFAAVSHCHNHASLVMPQMYR